MSTLLEFQLLPKSLRPRPHPQLVDLPPLLSEPPKQPPSRAGIRNRGYFIHCPSCTTVAECNAVLCHTVACVNGQCVETPSPGVACEVNRPSVNLCFTGECTAEGLCAAVDGLTQCEQDVDLSQASPALFGLVSSLLAVLLSVLLVLL